MVCLGNICRSPLAEGIMKAKLQNHFPKVIVDSAGTGAWHVGSPPDSRSIIVAEKYGVDISKQRARKINVEDFNHFDFIFTMDKEVHHSVLNLANTPEQKSKVHLLMKYAGNNFSEIVPDPYDGDDKEFEEVYVMIEKACSAIVERLLNR